MQTIMIIKCFLYIFGLTLIFIMSSCQTPNTHNAINTTDPQYLKISLSKEKINLNESFDINISYKFNNTITNAQISVFMEDSFSVIGYNSPGRIAKCPVYENTSVELSNQFITKKITLTPSSNFLNQGVDCQRFPSGYDNRTYKIVVSAQSNYYKDSSVLTVGKNRYKVVYYYVSSYNPPKDYNVFRNSTSRWGKIYNSYNNYNIELIYPTTNFYTGQITYDNTITSIDEKVKLYQYLTSHGIPGNLQGGSYEKDKTILLGFENLLFGKVYTDSFTFGVTWQRYRDEYGDGMAAISLIVFPKLEAFFIKNNYSETKRDNFRRALVMHELNHGRSSNCFNHPDNSTEEEKNCIMNEDLNLYENIINNSTFTICKYHKHLIQRRFWFPANLNF